MKTTSLIETTATAANDFGSAAFIGPRQPHLKLVEMEEAPALPPRKTAAEQMAIQQAMQKAALAANPPVSLSTPPMQQQPAPSFIHWEIQQQQQQTGGILTNKTPIQHQPERPYPWTPMKPQ